MVEGATVDSSLPDDCWETIFKFLINYDYGDNNNNNKYNYRLRPLSTVSKQFLSITNHLIFSLNVDIYYKPSDFLCRLIRRFPNLNSIHLTGTKLDKCLRKISHLPFITLKSLHLDCQRSRFPYNFPSDGLRLVSRNITTLTSLTFSNVHPVHSTHLFLIAECFPLLEQLNLSASEVGGSEGSLNEGVKALSSSLLKLRKVDLTNHVYINDQSLCYMFKNWKLLEEANITGCSRITTNGIASALRERPNLRSFSFSSPSYFDLEYAAKQFTVCPQLMSLGFRFCYPISNRNIGLLFASIFPNLQLLDLSWTNLYEDDICQVLRNCTELRQLNLANVSRMMLRVMNFDVPNLEVLNLSETRVDDEALDVISKSCRGLLKLILEHCVFITEKGVTHVVENCTKLREINLNGCKYVHADVVASMVLSRPSLRRIIPPQPIYCSSYTEIELFSRRRSVVASMVLARKSWRHNTHYCLEP